MIRSYQKLTEIIGSIENRAVAEVCYGAVYRVPKRIVLSRLKKILSGLDKRDSEYLVNKMWGIYEKCRKQAKNERKDTVRSELDKYVPGCTEVAERIATRARIQELSGLSGIFYVCSVFKDCAKDHLPYQGKLYVAEDWREKVKESDRAKVAEFIRRRKIRTVESVCFGPPYLITRPHCRHTLSNVSVKDALSGNYEPVMGIREVTDSYRAKKRRKQRLLLEVKKRTG